MTLILAGFVNSENFRGEITRLLVEGKRDTVRVGHRGRGEEDRGLGAEGGEEFAEFEFEFN